MSAADSEESRWPDFATASIRTQSRRSTVAQRSSSATCRLRLAALRQRRGRLRVGHRPQVRHVREISLPGHRVARLCAGLDGNTRTIHHRICAPARYNARVKRIGWISVGLLLVAAITAGGVLLLSGDEGGGPGGGAPPDDSTARTTSTSTPATSRPPPGPQSVEGLHPPRGPRGDRPIERRAPGSG